MGRFEVLLVAIVTGPAVASAAVGGSCTDRRPAARPAGQVDRRRVADRWRLSAPDRRHVGRGDRVDAARAAGLRARAARRRSVGAQVVRATTMHLTPREIDKLVLHQAGVLAQKRLARGLRLNYPEAVALIATQLLEFIRDGRIGRRADGSRPPAARPRRRDGRRRRHDRRSAGRRHVPRRHQARHRAPSDRRRARRPGARALRQLPARRRRRRRRSARRRARAATRPARCIAGDGEHRAQRGPRDRASSRSPTAATGRSRSAATITSSRPTARSSSIARAAYGMRLDIPAGTAVRFEPGETKTVALVAIAGAQVIRGGNALADGAVTTRTRARAASRAAQASRRREPR